MSSTDDDLDRPLWNAEAIGRYANILHEDGNVDIRRTYYLLEKKLLPGSKVGQHWVSTPRRLRSVYAGEAA
jgi:hypothetical protein